jgi:hypothetical protein
MSLDLRTDSPYAFLASTDDADLNGLAALTLTTWLKVESYPSNPSNNKRLIAKQATGATFPGFSFNMNATTNSGNPASADEFRLGLFAGSASFFNSGFSDADLGASAWTFIAATYDPAVGELKFYSGGLGNAAVTQLGNTILTVPDTDPIGGAGARFAVGLTDAAATADTSVTGWQDDVRVYNSALDMTALEAIRMENLQGGGGGFHAGDFTENNAVDGLDLVAWKTGFGTATGATHAQGDADSDMDVDGADFLVWQRELGLAGSGAAAVPEPGAALLLLIGAAAAFSRRAMN